VRPRLVPLVALVAPVALGLLLAACGSSTTTVTERSHPPPRTVTRTVTRGASDAGAPTGSGASTATTATGASPSTRSAAGGAGRCVAADLGLSFLGGAGATGHGELGFALRNTSSAPCRTGGYPGVLLLDAAGRGLPTHPQHTTSDFFGHTTLAALTVAPGETVSFRLGVSHVGRGGTDAGCVTAGGLQVIAPDDTQTLRVALPGISECGGTVSVSPLQPGTTAFTH
jgi:hypothetical protein